MTTLTEEDYLTAIYECEQFFGEAKLADIAKLLNVRPPTAYKVLRKLQEKGLVDYRRGGKVKLSDKGREVAERIVVNHRVFEAFLCYSLKFSPKEAHQIAKIMEHVPLEVSKRLSRMLDRKECPHGLPINGRGSPEGPLLIEKGPGKYQVRRVYFEEILLRYLPELEAGQEIEVIRIAFGKARIKVKGQEYEIPSHLLKFIEVM